MLGGVLGAAFRTMASGRRHLTLLTIALVITGASAAVASAGPQAGKYRATGAATFAFRLAEGSCPLPPKNLTNFRARRGPIGRGLCFSSSNQVPVNPDCGADGHPISGETADVSLFTGLRLNHGFLHVKAYSYTSAPKPIGFTEISLSVKGSRATGFVRVTDVDGLGHPCDTGALRFSASRH